MRSRRLIRSNSVLCFMGIANIGTPAVSQQALHSLNPVLSHSEEPEGLRISVRFEAGGGFGHEWVPPAGADLYRRSIGVACGSWEQLTDEPIAWNWDPMVDYGEAHMEFEVVDPGATPGGAYEYQVRAVDADRAPIESNRDVTVGVATHGEALLGHGQLWGGPDCGLSYSQSTATCMGECFPFLLFGTTGDVGQYINTGTTLLLYGQITGVHRSFCNEIVPVATFSTARPSLCVVGVESSTWSATKRLYR